MSDTTGRIRWEASPIGTGLRGYVGPDDNAIQIATISWGTVRHADKPWNLQTKLPGFTKVRTAATTDDAKALAERILGSFVRMVGANFPKADES